MGIFLFFIFAMLPMVAKADWGPGPPVEAVFAAGIGVALLVFAVLALISLVIKSIVELFRNKKKRHIWFQAIVIFLTLCLLFYAEYQENLLYDVEMKYDYETRDKTFNFLIFISLAFGWIIGYWITPKI
jgi:SNF family Na+-dependent transporter